MLVGKNFSEMGGESSMNHLLHLAKCIQCGRCKRDVVLRSLKVALLLCVQGYVVLNRPWAFVQWLRKATIAEEYV